MKVLLSWSGERSRHVANGLRTWLPSVIQAVDPWMSRHDISAGSRWARELEGKLEETDFGIFCVTRGNAEAPWLLFEAGALSKRVDESRVVPYLIDLEPSDLPQGPLSQFQAKKAERHGTFELVKSINSTLGAHALGEPVISGVFEKWWPDLEEHLLQRPSDESTVARPTDEKIDEILLLLRELARENRALQLSKNAATTRDNLEIEKALKWRAAGVITDYEMLTKIEVALGLLSPEEGAKRVCEAAAKAEAEYEASKE